MGRFAQQIKHEKAQKISSKISPNSSPNSSPKISPGHKNLSPQFRSGECRYSPKPFSARFRAIPSAQRMRLQSAKDWRLGTCWLEYDWWLRVVRAHPCVPSALHCKDVPEARLDLVVLTINRRIMKALLLFGAKAVPEVRGDEIRSF